AGGSGEERGDAGRQALFDVGIERVDGVLVGAAETRPHAGGFDDHEAGADALAFGVDDGRAFGQREIVADTVDLVVRDQHRGPSQALARAEVDVATNDRGVLLRLLGLLSLLGRFGSRWRLLDFGSATATAAPL